MNAIHPCRLVALLVVSTALCGPSETPAAEQAASSQANVHPRGSFDNARIQFERTGRGTVAFIGGSITEMNGYRPMVCQMLQKRFPKTAFTFVDAGISSTCSTTGAFRLQRDVLSKGPIDLLFIEFAVNDDQDAHHTRDECVRGMEGILRQALRSNPAMDIVVTYFVNPEMLELFDQGKTPLPIAAHEAVAEHYGVSTVNLAKEVSEQIAAGKLTWKQYGGVHPAPPGNAICAGMIERMLADAWSKPLAADAEKTPHKLSEPLDRFSYAAGRFIDPAQAKIVRGWTLGVPDWSKLPGSKRSRFTEIPMLWADQPGAEVSLEFEGTAIGAYVVAGPDAGILEAEIDGQPAGDVDLLHRFSANLHYPRTVMLATELPPGRHKLVLRVSKRTSGTGHAARIMQFTAS